jgi:hypothetical protein
VVKKLDFQEIHEVFSPGYRQNAMAKVVVAHRSAPAPFPEIFGAVQGMKISISTDIWFSKEAQVRPSGYVKAG